jgi:adenosylcobinamide-phosphate synthase
MGRLCLLWEKVLYRPSVLAGAVFWTAYMATITGAVTLMLFLLGYAPSILNAMAATYLTYACMATRSLHHESRKVEDALAKGEFDEARRRLSFIVSRETADLSPHHIRRAAIETVAENLSDGVIAPMFFCLLLGVPGMLLYKAINTLDSMVGYKNERYMCFGRISARVDDWVNHLPARITGLLVLVVSLFLRLDTGAAWRIMGRDHGNASSPNAGWPESAIAGAIGVRLGGPSTYFGLVVEKPHIGDDPGRELAQEDYRSAIRVLYAAAALMASICTIILARAGAGWWGLAGRLF